MRSLLLQNAREIHSAPCKREASRRKIKAAVYMERTLYSMDEFLRLVWMDAESILGSHLYNQLTPSNQSRTLKNLVKRIRQHYPGGSPHAVLEVLNHRLSSLPHVERYERETNTSMNNTWFEGCVAMNGTFDPRLIRELWVRDLKRDEAEQSPDGIYYIEDGSHRALVYALNLEFEETEYFPITVCWCKSWRHIFRWSAEPGP